MVQGLNRQLWSFILLISHLFLLNIDFSYAIQASLTRDFNVTGGYVCLKEAFPHDEGKIILPENKMYEQASKAIGSKWKKAPIAIVYPSNTEEASTAARCAFQNGIPITVSSGKHSFQGASIQNGYLVIDLSQSCRPPEIDSKSLTMSMSGGCLHADVIGALHKFQTVKTNDLGVMALIGAMPLVGYGGWSMGGGFGNLAPYVGIGCDQYINITVVMYNGTIVHANQAERSELLWGLCGGGGGFGIVTEMTIKLTVSPDATHFTRLVISYPVKTLPEVLFRLQNALLSKREIRFGAHGPTVTAQQDEDSMVQFFFLYLGSWQEAVSCMKELGLLSRELYPYPVKSLFGAPPQALIVNHSPRFAWGKLPSYANIIAVEYSSYPYAMAPMLLIDALAMNITRMCQAIECFASLPNPMSKKAHTDLLDMAGNRSSLLYNASESTTLNSPSNVYRNFHQPGQLINQLPLEAWKELVDIPRKLSVSHGCTFTIPHVVGGNINSVAPNETAYPWRNASIVFVGYGNEQQFCWEQFSKVISRYQRIQGYYNYLGHDISQNWEQLYFGENVQRIAEIRRLYDPYNFFTKPSVVSLGSAHIA
jgi:hypothetical protein